MTGPMALLAKMRSGAVMMTAALLLCGETHAQSSGGGPLNFFGNVFTGSLSKGNQTPPSGQRPNLAPAQPAPAASSGRSHGAARTAPPAIP